MPAPAHAGARPRGPSAVMAHQMGGRWSVGEFRLQTRDWLRFYGARMRFAPVIGYIKALLAGLEISWTDDRALLGPPGPARGLLHRDSPQSHASVRAAVKVVRRGPESARESRCSR